MKLEEVNILGSIKKLYPEIDKDIEKSDTTNLTDLVNQIISNIKTNHTNDPEITQENINTYIKISIEKTLLILNNK